MAYLKDAHARVRLLSAPALLTAVASPAHAADQFKQAVDGAGIECSVSARELTRFALVDDQFASVSKISTGDRRAEEKKGFGDVESAMHDAGPQRGIQTVAVVIRLCYEGGRESAE